MLRLCVLVMVLRGNALVPLDNVLVLDAGTRPLLSPKLEFILRVYGFFGGGCWQESRSDLVAISYGMACISHLGNVI